MSYRKIHASALAYVPMWYWQLSNVVQFATDFATVPAIDAKSRELINRLLRYADKEIEYAIHALSACRRFDLNLYLTLGKTLYFHATAPAFDILTQFSFVWQDKSEGDENGYRIHDFIKRYRLKRRITIYHRLRVIPANSLVSISH